jgi:hypothetical protein
MFALLVWLAGCVFGVWVIFHFGYDREAIAFSVLAAVFFWIVGGAGWIGQKLKAGAAVRGADGLRRGTSGAMHLSEADREALRKAVASKTHEQSSV